MSRCQYVKSSSVAGNSQFFTNWPKPSFPVSSPVPSSHSGPSGSFREPGTCRLLSGLCVSAQVAAASLSSASEASLCNPFIILLPLPPLSSLKGTGPPLSMLQKSLHFFSFLHTVLLFNFHMCLVLPTVKTFRAVGMVLTFVLCSPCCLMQYTHVAVQ